VGREPCSSGQGSEALIGSLHIHALPTNRQQTRTGCCTCSSYKIMCCNTSSDKNFLRGRACMRPRFKEHCAAIVIHVKLFPLLFRACLAPISPGPSARIYEELRRVARQLGHVDVGGEQGLRLLHSILLEQRLRAGDLRISMLRGGEQAQGAFHRCLFATGFSGLWSSSQDWPRTDGRGQHFCGSWWRSGRHRTLRGFRRGAQGWYGWSTCSKQTTPGTSKDWGQ